MTAGTRLCTWLNGKLVGTDEFGNRYYTERREPVGRRARRWVIYQGEAEASKVPAEWHAWLHYTTEQPIAADVQGAKPWMRPHVPNLTGTADAYLPPGDDRRGGRRERSASDYESWRP